MKLNITLTGLLVGLMMTAGAQNVLTPRPSPNAEIEQDIGLTTFKVMYSRPGAKDRAIFGGLVQYDKVWRTGANASTQIEFDRDIKLGGKDVKAGSYSIMTIPSEAEWTFILSSDMGVSEQTYDQDKDVIRIMVKPEKYSEKVETFTINFTDIRDASANLQLLWENTSVKIPIEVNTKQQVMAGIEKAMTGTSSRDYYLAARYYYDNDEDVNKALTWINMAVEKDGDDPKFWVIHYQAKILAKAGKTKEAIKAAERSKELAVKAEYEAYVKRNDELIKELSAKKK
jgi:hypothetical protein